MSKFANALLGMPLLLAPHLVMSQPIPDALSVEWQGKKPCEKLHEDAQITVMRCIFPPGAVHLRHFHPGNFSYTLSGGTGQVEDATGKRQAELRTDSFRNNQPIAWHEFTNVGTTTLSYLIVEKKYEPVTAPERASAR